MKHILKCRSCGKYTMQEKCSCGGTTAIVIPAKFSPEDRYAHLRRKAKEIIQDNVKKNDLES